MREIITGTDIDKASRAGQAELRVGAEAVITGVARERAEKLGIRIVAGPGGQAQGGQAFMPAFAGASARAGGSAAAGAPTGASRPSYDLEAWRKKFPILKKAVHVANCSQSPQSDQTRAAAMAYLDNWDGMGMDWGRWMEEIALAKAEFAKLINAKPSEIAIGTSVSELTSAVGSSLPLNTGRMKVVTTEAEFPTVGNIWNAFRKFDFQPEFLKVRNGTVDLSEYDRLLDERTLIASIFDVYYYNGFKQDLAAIIPKIHAVGALAYVDAYQGIGSHPIDVKALDIDILATGNLKYLCGIPGVAFMYVKEELVPHLEPAFTGWFGQKNPFAFKLDLDFAMDARRFDNGTPPVLTAYIARAGMAIINEVGPAAIQAWTDVLSRRCIEGAQARGMDIASPLDIARKAPTTAIRVGPDSHHVELALREAGIIASARGDVIRIAPHFFTRLEDIDYVLDSLEKVLKRR
ncbi:MAG TPA: aminotransferase class V-fold PLP-dependent enzyme [Rectinemataceae bacterium]|nr:aminotransferase class V-fold PLP-dependent enzyme [Rectinemataceae bacterium]